MEAPSLKFQYPIYKSIVESLAKCDTVCSLFSNEKENKVRIEECCNTSLYVVNSGSSVAVCQIL